MTNNAMKHLVLLGLAAALSASPSFAGVCNVTYGMRMSGGMSSGDITNRVVRIQGVATGLVVYYIKNNNWGTVYQSHVIFTKMSAAGDADSLSLNPFNSLINMLMSQDRKTLTWFGSQAGSWPITFSAELTNEFILGFKTANWNPAAQVNAIWGAVETGVPVLHIQTYSPNRGFQTTTLEVVCPGVYHSGYDSTVAELVSTPTDAGTVLTPRVSLAWRSMAVESAGAIYFYRVYRSESRDVVGSELATMPVTTKTYVDNSVEIGKRYFYRIRALTGTHPGSVTEATPRNEAQNIAEMKVPYDPAKARAAILNVVNILNE